MAFGEIVTGYPVPVLNEREARAGAGILFVVAMVAFMNAWLIGNFTPTVFVIIGFFVDFFIRVFINPKYAPSLILGRFAVRNQQPEYTGAAQKRFAWALGFLLAAGMVYYVVILGVRGGPVTMLICMTCLLLLFFETAFGICLGCMIYNAIHKEKAQLCPGGACEIHQRAEIQRINGLQFGALAAFVIGIAVLPSLAPGLQNARYGHGSMPMSDEKGEAERCQVPSFAKVLGHEEKWKLHNNCK